MVILIILLAAETPGQSPRKVWVGGTTKKSAAFSVRNHFSRVSVINHAEWIDRDVPFCPDQNRSIPSALVSVCDSGSQIWVGMSVIAESTTLIYIHHLIQLHDRVTSSLS